MRLISGVFLGLSLFFATSCSKTPTGKPSEQVSQSRQSVVVIETKDGKPFSAHDLLHLSEKDVLALLGEPSSKMETKDSKSGAQQTWYVYSLAVPKKAWTVAVLTVVLEQGFVVDVKYAEHLVCIAHGTLIETSNGALPIETLQVGDKVWSYDFEKGEAVLATVNAISSDVAYETLIFGQNLRVTPSHPIYVGNVFKAAKEISPTDNLTTRSGRVVAAGDIQLIREKVMVYDLSVSGPHNFFAGGILVHNKSP